MSKMECEKTAIDVEEGSRGLVFVQANTSTFVQHLHFVYQDNQKRV